MSIFFKIFFKTTLFVILTILTQIGGIVYLLSDFIAKKSKIKFKLKGLISFIVIYLFSTFLIVPFIASLFGREKIICTEKIQPTNKMTLILNRNYVKPELNTFLKRVENNLANTNITINFLDANFPFFDGFPLLPHLSHNDGLKLDLSLVYETRNGEISDKQKSNSGYGVFEEPKNEEFNQIEKCLSNGYFQYDYPKYLTFGTINKELLFSKKGTKRLIEAILKEEELEKLFIEPHLKNRLRLNNNKIRYHGCRAVRHDDHIHIQL